MAHWIIAMRCTSWRRGDKLLTSPDVFGKKPAGGPFSVAFGAFGDRYYSPLIKACSENGLKDVIRPSTRGI
jgi:hypothetical protein